MAQARDSPDRHHATAEWRPEARRIAPLVDGIEYFAAVRSAMIAAQREIFIVDWEIHSEIDLVRGRDARRKDPHRRWPVRLADLLRALVDERPDLRVRLLVWEGASLFAAERQHLPRMKRPWDRHERITLEWDRTAPPLASQHQKIVVVDDRVAFVGGMDLTKSRWDSHEHRVRDRRRRKPGLLPFYGNPYHDAMLACDGDAARMLGDWCRERWRRALGERLEAPPDADLDRAAASNDPWPRELEPLLTDRPIELALTWPEHDGHPEKRQVEASLLEQIRSAERLIFIETQYLAAANIVDALTERLRAPDGPEIVLILPYGCPGRLQSMAMDTQRDDLLDRLRAADAGGRFGAFWVALKPGDLRRPFKESVYIHAKTMVIDDRLLRVGSANLNSRSMGVDSELDATVAADSDADRAAIAGYRRRLLGYLLGVAPERVVDAERGHAGVLGAIDALRRPYDAKGEGPSLRSFTHRADPGRKPPVDIALADPERPVGELDAERVLEAISKDVTIPEKLRKALAVVIGGLRRHKLTVGVLLAAGAALAALWFFTPLGDVDREQVRTLVDRVRESPAGAAGVLAGFVLLGSVGFPITVLVVGVGAIFDVGWALGICLLGVAGSAMPGFWLGGWMSSGGGREPGPRMKRLARLFRGRGVITVAVARNVPIAPYAVANTALGFAGLRWYEYLIGTMIGMAPGVVLLTVFGDEMGELFTDPTPATVLRAVAVGATVIIMAVAAQRLLRRFMPGQESVAPEAERQPADRGARGGG